MTSPLSARFDDLLVVARSGVLDPEWYLRTHVDVAAAGADPYEHFLGVGWREGRDPGPHFSTAWYLDTYPDVHATGANPLVDYLTVGWRAGRLPNPGFTPPAQADLMPDVCPLVLALALLSAAAPSPVQASARIEVATLSRDPALRPPAATPLRTVAFYLPQYHPIPENDTWWGEGFTDWRNVRRGLPRFPAHQQPHVPTELGYYDLRDPMVLRRQVELARRHGVTAFCFYTYWFNGHRLLERPLDSYLADPSLDLEFCVCWANENWTRTWDGDDRHVLIEQHHSPEDDLRFIETMAPALRDPRYLRVDGRPVLLVYRPSLLPDARATADRWRGWCRRHGVGEIMLAYVQSFERGDPRAFGFDVAVEFPPNATAPLDVTDAVGAPAGYQGKVYDGAELAARSRALHAPPYPLWRGVCTSWDNEARRPGRGTALHGLTPERMSEWLANVGRETCERLEPSSRLVFINAWNEWAEGAHLEPDAAHGHAWLNAVRSAQEAVAGAPGDGPGVVVVAHDMHPHGAQLGSIALAREIAMLGLPVELVALGGGPLRERFESAANLHVLDEGWGDRDSAAAAAREVSARDLAADLRRRGFTTALCNSAVTGAFAAELREAGVTVVGLVHEFPGVLADAVREEPARRLAAAVDRLVFPSETVRDAFPFPVPVGTEVEVRPQGCYRRARGDASDARRWLRERLGLPSDALVVAALGFGDHRKGIDRLVATSQLLPATIDDRAVAVAWVGHVDRHDARITAALAAAPARFHRLGFLEDPDPVLLGADALALPSREDPFPSVVLEAHAVGLPVVAVAGATGAEEEIRRAGGILTDGTAEGMAAGLVGALGQAPGESVTRRGLVARDHAFRTYVLDLLAGTPAAMPRVSVVVPNYNYGELIADRLEQVLAQSYPVYELVVLDDGSTDGSLGIIRASTQGLEPSVTVVANAHNSGSVYRQWVEGVARTRGDLIWIAEADDVADPDFLALLVARSRFPGVVMTYCQSRQLGPDGTEIAPDYRSYVSDVGARDWSRPYVAEGTAELAECLAVKNTVPSVSAVLFDGPTLRQALDALGDVSSDFPTAGDYRVYAEVLRRGRIAFEPVALNGHRRHADSVTARGVGVSHVEEIRGVQAVVRRQTAPTPAATRAGDAYLDELTDRFTATRHDQPPGSGRRGA